MGKWSYVQEAIAKKWQNNIDTQSCLTPKAVLLIFFLVMIHSEWMSAQSCLTLWPMDYSLQAPLSMEFSKQVSWSGLPFPTPRDLPDPGIKPTSLASSALTDRFFSTKPPRKPLQKLQAVLYYQGLGFEEGNDKRWTREVDGLDIQGSYELY